MTQNASEICHCLLLATLLFQKGIEYRHSLQSVLPTHNPISLWPKLDQSLVSVKHVIPQVLSIMYSERTLNSGNIWQ